jgi:hypothetical protein
MSHHSAERSSGPTRKNIWAFSLQYEALIDVRQCRDRTTHSATRASAQRLSGEFGRSVIRVGSKMGMIAQNLATFCAGWSEVGRENITVLV